MVMAFYVKLGALFLKQVSKPLASQLKTTATTHPELKRMVTRLGQKMHEWSVAVTNRINENDGRTAFAGRLDEEVALKKAADFIGEVFIFTVAGGIVAYEVTTNMKKESAKAAALAEDKQKLLDTLASVKLSVEQTALRMDSMERRIAAVEASSASKRASWSSLWPFRSTLSEAAAAGAVHGGVPALS